MGRLTKSEGSSIPVELSISKIHRLFRPLSTKAQALAKFLNQPSALLTTPGKRAGVSSSHFFSPAPFFSSPYRRRPILKVTYGSKRRGNTLFASQSHSQTTHKTGLGPLSALPQPQALNKFHAWDKAMHHGVPLHDLATKTTAVRDAFRTLIEGVYSNEAWKRRDGLRPLSEMCASVMGAGIEDLVAAARDDDEDVEDEMVTRLVDGVYEDIPEHLRRWAVVPHAIAMIDEIVPISLPSLWEMLLDLCIEAGSRSDIHAVLVQVLVRALMTTSVGHPLNTKLHEYHLVHILHKSFKCSQDLVQAESSSSSRLCWSEDEFVCILLQAMEEAEASELEWGVKALDRLFNELRDPFARLRLVYGLSISFQKDTHVLKRLQWWILDIIRRDMVSPLGDDDDDEAVAWVEDLYATTLFLLEICCDKVDDAYMAIPHILALATHTLTMTGARNTRSLVLQMEIAHALSISKSHSTIIPTIISPGPALSPSLLLSLRSFIALFPPSPGFLPCVQKYARILRRETELVALEVMFLWDVIQFAEDRVEGKGSMDDGEDDPEPLLDDYEMEDLQARLERAEILSATRKAAKGDNSNHNRKQNETTTTLHPGPTIKRKREDEDEQAQGQQQHRKIQHRSPYLAKTIHRTSSRFFSGRISEGVDPSHPTPVKKLKPRASWLDRAISSDITTHSPDPLNALIVKHRRPTPHHEYPHTQHKTPSSKPKPKPNFALSITTSATPKPKARPKALIVKPAPTSSPTSDSSDDENEMEVVPRPPPRLFLPAVAPPAAVAARKSTGDIKGSRAQPLVRHQSMGHVQQSLKPSNRATVPASSDGEFEPEFKQRHPRPTLHMTSKSIIPTGRGDGMDVDVNTLSSETDPLDLFAIEQTPVPKRALARKRP